MRFLNLSLACIIAFQVAMFTAADAQQVGVVTAHNTNARSIQADGTRTIVRLGNNVYYNDEKIDCPEFDQFMNEDYLPLTEKYGLAAGVQAGKGIVQGCVDRFLIENPDKAPTSAFPWLDKNRKYAI